MKCPRCDFENPEESRFCGNCASPLTPAEVPEESRTKTFTGPPSDLARGRLFAGRYEVMEDLGSGGMGKVYKVFDNKLQEVVALKLVRPELAWRAQTLERFREEIRLARKITHKNVCRMHDINEAEGISYITMEYIPGEDLKSIIRMMGRLSPGQAIVIAKQVCSGLAEAHKMGIIHRDLKPKNIMVDRQGNARIMDFGLARSLEEKGITGGRVMLGTPEYMSPEQVDGKKAGSRSDVYSLGVVLFEMVTGKIPFEGESALSIAVKHKTEPPPDPREINGQVPETLSRIILKCLEKEEEKRFQSAEELCLELEKLEKAIPTEEKILPKKRPSTLDNLVKHPPLRKIAFPALAIIVAILLSVLAWQNLSKKNVALTPKGKISLVVLPFKNNTGDETLEVWREALAENLISELRRSSQNLMILSADTIRSVIRTTGLSQAASFSSEDLQKVAGSTGVSHIVLGSYSQTRMYYDLKDMHQNVVVGGGRAEGEGEKDFNRMTDELTGQILADLKLSARAQPRRILTTSSWANRCYLLGRQAERKYKETKNVVDFSAALTFYEKGVAEDPAFALPYWGLGDLYQVRYVITKKAEDLELTLRYYEKAYQSAPDLAGPNSGLGWAYFLQGDNDRAFTHFKRSLELEPGNPSIHYNIGSFFRSIGLLEQAIKFYTKAIDLGEPSFMAYWLRATCWERLSDYDKAVEDAKRLFEMEPDNVSAALLYARMLICQRKFDDAEREIVFTENLRPDLPDLRFTRALLYAARGERQKALPLLEEAREKPIYYSSLLSRAYALLGMKDEALENIRLGIMKGFEETQDYLYEYPFLASSYFFDSLRDDPRFREILEKQKAVYLENLKKYGGL
jgi:serine/threonine protein kinase/Flp pilus assembly protein TadD